MLRKYQILEEDLDKAIEETVGKNYDICTACIFSQAISRILGKPCRTAQAGNVGMSTTVDMRYLYSENWVVMDSKLNNLTRLFDEIVRTSRDFQVIRSMLPFEFEFDFGE